MTQWQPIETAPRDGDPFIATGSGQVYVVAWGPEVKGQEYPWIIFEGVALHSPEGCCDREDAERIVVNGWMKAAPTHWMPLPEAPQ